MNEWFFEYWHNLLLASWVAYLVLLVCTILLQQRNPISSIAWILSLSFIPFAGLLIYHFLGPRKIDKQRMNRQQKQLFVRHQQKLWADKFEFTAVDDKFAPIVNLIRKTTNMPPTYTTDYEIYSGGEATYTAIFKAIDEAKEACFQNSFYEKLRVQR